MLQLFLGAALVDVYMGMSADVVTCTGAACAHPDLITIIDAFFLKFNICVNLFANDVDDQSISSFDDNSGECTNAM